eukprot:1288426-Rhodomonas_salina.1
MTASPSPSAKLSYTEQFAIACRAAEQFESYLSHWGHRESILKLRSAWDRHAIRAFFKVLTGIGFLTETHWKNSSQGEVVFGLL